jgi:hypothetical protein
MPDVTDKDCDAVEAAFAKHPDTEQKLAALRTRVQSGELDFQQMRTESQKIYEAAGVDGRIAGACRMRERQRAGAGDSTQRGGRESASGAQRGGTRARRTIGIRTAAGGGVSTPVQAGEFTARARAAEPRVRRREWHLCPRIVRLGVGNFDYTEVVSGLKEGDRLRCSQPPAMQARREEQNNRMRNMGGLPGMTPNRPGAGAPGGGAAARTRRRAGGQARP